MFIIVYIVCHITICDLTIGIRAGFLISTNMTFMDPKVPKFDEKNFLVWKEQTLKALHYKDEYLLKAVKEGPYIPMTQPMKYGKPHGEKVPTNPLLFSKLDKRLVHYDYTAKMKIINSLPHSVYLSVQYATSAKGSHSEDHWKVFRSDGAF